MTIDLHYFIPPKHIIGVRIPKFYIEWPCGRAEHTLHLEDALDFEDDILDLEDTVDSKDDAVNLEADAVYLGDYALTLKANNWNRTRMKQHVRCITAN